MIKLLTNASQIVTVGTGKTNLKRGNDLSDIGLLEDYAIVLENDIIQDLVPNYSLKKSSEKLVIDLKDKVILPGLVECHTHTAFAGSRGDEFRERLRGTSYEEISLKGGGINSTVKSVRMASFEDLLKQIIPRIDYFISQGITTLEIKSGYGLSYYDEIKLLQVINHLNSIYKIDIIPTFLGAHTYPPEYKNDHYKYLDIIINEMIPFISENNLAIFCDGFCEKTAFSAQEVDKIFAAAVNSGLKLKLHTEQFNNIGGLDIALKYKSTSVDHLEVLQTADIKKLGESDTVCVLLPGVSFFLNYDYAPARKLIQGNAVIALATDFNPGSSHIANLNLIMSLAAINMNMSIEEVISAVTINAAAALDLNNSRGSIEPGKKADFAVFDTKEYADIVYSVGKNLNCMTIKNSEIIYNQTN